MKALLASVAILGLAGSAAFATESDVLVLTDADMDTVTAGQPPNGALINVSDINVGVPVQAGVCVIVERCTDVTDPQSLRLGRQRP
jgi:hypothetical protein